MESRSSAKITPRTEQRVIAEAEVRLHIPAAQSADSVDLIASFKSLDLSAGGVQVGVDEPLRLNTILRLNITVPSAKESFRLMGRVAWCHLNEVKQPSWLVGIHLVDCEPSELHHWRKTIEQLS